jgi:ABC-type multidrug transport system fused ATPase/permease subunit
VPFKSNISLDRVNFAYEKSNTSVIKNLSVTIDANKTIGIVGESGSGKTTIVDILIGLLEPDEGELKVDKKPVVGPNLRNWRSNVGYVPQNIFLLDDTIRRNIALGVPDRDINEARLKLVVEMAQMTDVVKNLSEGYDTVMGEHGIRLSGGQRQRIGIARALYSDARLLILDEATSSLDYRTEAAVHKSIEWLAGKLTIVVIAHRLSTVRNCDHILVLKAGEIIAQGDYEYLIKSSSEFRELVDSEHA